VLDLFGDRYALMTVSNGVGLLVNLALFIALLIVAFGAVRKVRKSASGLIAVYAIGGIVTMCLGPALNVATSRLGDPGADSWVTMMALTQLVMTVIHAGLFALLIAGIVQLARPPSRDARDPEV
jgi:uncharacterized membrane protein YhaH (DUF805 family)